MRKKKTLMVFILALSVLVVVGIMLKNKSNLTSPEMLQDQVRGSSSDSLPEGGIKTPPRVIYDSSTDLENELDSVNPRITDEDFVPLKKVIESLR